MKSPIRLLRTEYYVRVGLIICVLSLLFMPFLNPLLYYLNLKIFGLRWIYVAGPPIAIFSAYGLISIADRSDIAKVATLATMMYVFYLGSSYAVMASPTANEDMLQALCFVKNYSKNTLICSPWLSQPAYSLDIDFIELWPPYDPKYASKLKEDRYTLIYDEHLDCLVKVKRIPLDMRGLKLVYVGRRVKVYVKG